jgi:hypothetical protein
VNAEDEIAAALLEAEVDKAIAACGGDAHDALRATLIANAYLEAEIERLTEAISTGFARGRMRKAPERAKKIERSTQRLVRSGLLRCNDYD